MLNLIVICVDSWRADILCERGGSNWIHAPVLKDFARQCVVFDRAFGEAMPTVQMRRGFFTGMRSYPWHHDVDGVGLSPGFLGWHRIPSSHATLAETLLAAGYCTGLITDCYHLFKPTQNFTRGFLTWEFIRGQQGDNYRVGSAGCVDLCPYVPDGEEHDYATHSHIVQHLLSTRGRRREEDYFAPQVFRAAVDWLRDAHSNSPFMLWVDSFTPHELWDPPAHCADRYFANDGSLKDFIHPGAMNRLASPSREQIERTRALYAGSCTLVDTWIGHLLETIDELGLAGDTIVMFVTDHGTELWDDGQFTKFGANAGKLHPYNTQLNWFIRHPNGPRDQHVSALVQNHDLLPTVLELLDQPPCELLNGQSVWPLVTGERQALRRRAISGWGQWASLRDLRWNCILNPTTSDGSPRLFDLVNDPDEKRNVAAEFPTVVAECCRELEGLVGGPFPVAYKHQPDAGDYMTLKSYFKRLALRVERPPRGREVERHIIPFTGRKTIDPDRVSENVEPRKRMVG